MLSVRRPIDAVSIAVGALLGALGAVQWRESGDFADHALQVTATLVDSRETKKQVLDAAPETYLRVEFSAAGGDIVRTELPDPLQSSAGPPPEKGERISIWYDPRSPQTARLTRGAGRKGALVLLALAAGALFAPAILRRSLRGSGGGG